jgi:hypothetical protein
VFVVTAFYNGQVLDGNPVLITQDLMFALSVAFDIEEVHGYKLYGLDAGVSVNELEENIVYKQRKFLPRGENAKRPVLLNRVKEGDGWKEEWANPELEAKFLEYRDRVKEGLEAHGPKVVALSRTAHK